MSRHSRKKKPEFSKIIAVIGITMWFTVNVFGMIMIAKTYDLSPLSYVIGSVDAVVAVVLGFYFWKAKAENQIKLKQQYGDLANGAADVDSSNGSEPWGR